MHGQGKAFGRYTIWGIDRNGLWTPCFSKRNTLMATWGFAAAKCLGQGDASYAINRVYVEFENVAAPATAATIPTYDSKDGRDYYDGLAAPNDYLRLLLREKPSIEIVSGYESVFASDEGNRLVFSASTSGSVGVNGRTFSAAVNSKVKGIALVAAPDDSDRTKDVIVTRGYFAVGEQKLKEASEQIGVTWELELTD